MSDFNQLLEQKAKLTERLESLEAEEKVLRASLDLVLEEKSEIAAELAVNKAQAKALAEELFGITPEPTPPPVAQPPAQPVVPVPTQPRKPDNSIVFDEPRTVVPASMPNFQI